MIRSLSPTALCLVGLLLVGCNGQSSTDSTASDPIANVVDVDFASLVLGQMPEGDVSTPTEIMELGGKAAPAIVAGRIDAGDVDPFQPGEMTFMISQLPDEDHAGDDPDHADNCPFCKHKLESAPKAIVQFCGPDGSVLAGDAQRSLSLEKGDIVYVTGTAQYNPAINTVMVNATGIFRKSRS
ncbi:MAG: hypothetical protein KDB00_19160 [Planctomycetales bacterium]|nr:hypothetical protein [Planctomycetales bacterium]